MSDPSNSDEYRNALAIRNFEIDLLWKRIGYYWAFVAATFIAYGTLNKPEGDPFATFVVAHFGLVTTIGWFYFIKGSKYWQQHWEQKLANLESPNGLFLRDVKVKTVGELEFGPARYSVTKVTMWFSAVACVLWLGITVHEWGKFLGIHEPISRYWQGAAVLALSFVALHSLRTSTKSSGLVKRRRKKKKKRFPNKVAPSTSK